jgi:hypothetical protein
MGRKRREKPMEAVAEPKTWFVRLDLTTEVHHLLRMAAAKHNLSMAAYARLVVERAARVDVSREDTGRRSKR